jgi:hypothetical protein
MSDCSRSVFLLSGSVTIMARTFFVFRLYRPRLVSICCLKNVSALWDALDVTFVSSTQSYPVHLFRPHMKISILWLVMLVDCMFLFMVGVSSILSHVSLLFFRMHHPCLVSLLLFSKSDWEVSLAHGCLQLERSAQLRLSVF